jgi:hypothetical protein
MNNNQRNVFAREWTALGAMFNVTPSRGTPDLERLLLQTARLASSSTPHFVLAITWLAAYGELVARHRLAKLIADELESPCLPAMGLLLESTLEHAPRLTHHFQVAIKCCSPAAQPGPLLDIDKRNPSLHRLAHSTATRLSRKWGLWSDPIELKKDALRPPEWLARKHSSLALRALVGGDLIASILAEASDESRANFRSEVELAERCGASRPAIRDALAKMRLAGLVNQHRAGFRNEIHVKNFKL